ncbi:MAG: DUF2934 domain-containing protein [Gammaproteobacteria bacterium]|nr:DUF2934 domain-containing protein [Gammaproteobacteria bacterium]
MKSRATQIAGRRTRRPAPAARHETRAADAGERESMIAEAAYFRAEARAFEAGHELEDWLAAEREVDLLLEGERLVDHAGLRR